MFDISPRDRYLHGDPAGLAVTAMVYGRLRPQPERSRLSAHQRPVVPWSLNATPPQEHVCENWACNDARRCPSRRTRTRAKPDYPEATRLLLAAADKRAWRRRFEADLERIRRAREEALLARKMAELQQHYRKH